MWKYIKQFFILTLLVSAGAQGYPAKPRQRPKRQLINPIPEPYYQKMKHSKPIN
jgi:hypothetical protein